MNALQSDELIGEWHNDGDDGSGFRAIWGWCYKFKKDGTGVYLHWGPEQNDNTEILFEWKRVNQNSILFCYTESKDEWNKLEYIKTAFKGPYGTIYWKIIDLNYTPNKFANEGFLGHSGGVYKQRRY